MEIIRKTINLDTSKSHRLGLVPFIAFGDSNAGIKYTSSINSNGNYGGFACDIIKFNKKVKYLDMLRRYNYIQEILNTAVYVSGSTFSIERNSVCEESISLTEIRYFPINQFEYH